MTPAASEQAFGTQSKTDLVPAEVKEKRRLTDKPSASAAPLFQLAEGRSIRIFNRQDNRFPPTMQKRGAIMKNANRVCNVVLGCVIPVSLGCALAQDWPQW